MGCLELKKKAIIELNTLENPCMALSCLVKVSLLRKLANLGPIEIKPHIETIFNLALFIELLLLPTSQRVITLPTTYSLSKNYILS